MEGGSSEIGSVGGSNSNSKDQERLPPGFRFHPTDEELITYYLESKISDANFTGRAITDVDLNKCEPWDLPGKAKMGEKEWYFFSLRDRKYPTGVRTNRATNTGYWKTTGKDKEIFNSVTSQLVGMKKTLVFYRGRAPRGEKTNWVMHEYRIHSKPHFRTSKDEWVVCRVFQKSAGAKKYTSNQPRVLSNQYNIEMGQNGGGCGLLPPQMMVAADNYQQFPLARNYLMMSSAEQQLAELSRAYRSNALNLPMNQPQVNMYPSLGHGGSSPAPGSCFTISGLNLNLGTPTAQPVLRPMHPSLLNQHDVAPSNIPPTSGAFAPEPSCYTAEMNAAHAPSNRYMGVDNCMDLDGYWPSY